MRERKRTKPYSYNIENYNIVLNYYKKKEMSDLLCCVLKRYKARPSRTSLDTTLNVVGRGHSCSRISAHACAVVTSVGTRLAFHAVLDPGESCITATLRGVARVENDELGLTELHSSLSSHRWYTEEGRELDFNPPKLARQAGRCHTSDSPTEFYPTSRATTFFVEGSHWTPFGVLTTMRPNATQNDYHI